MWTIDFLKRCRELIQWISDILFNNDARITGTYMQNNK